ncbi:MAG: PAS domain S-box protein [Rubrivivax sp.]|nr:MAG: PAS domain S-box protein [Rubrivivax sp.]
MSASNCDHPTLSLQARNFSVMAALSSLATGAAAGGRDDIALVGQDIVDQLQAALPLHAIYLRLHGPHAGHQWAVYRDEGGRDLSADDERALASLLAKLDHPSQPLVLQDLPGLPAVFRGIACSARAGQVEATVLLAHPASGFPHVADTALLPPVAACAALLAGTAWHRDAATPPPPATDLRDTSPQSRERLIEVFRQVPSFMCVLSGPDHVYEWANDRHNAHLGGRQVMGKPVREALPEVAAQGFIELLDQVYRTGESYVGHHLPVVLQRHPDGTAETRYVDVVYQALRGADGRPSGILVQGVDITEQTLAQAALRQKEDRLKLLVDGIQDYAVIVTDPQGVITEWEAGAASITGYEAQEAIGQTLDLIFSDADVSSGVPDHEQQDALRLGRVKDKRWHVGKHGHRFFADGVTTPLHDADGALMGFGKIFRDVSADQTATQQLAELMAASARRERLYETILSNTPDLVYVFDLEHRFIYANAVLLRMWGKTWDEAIGKNCLELGYEPWHAAMHGREIEQVKATRQPIRGEVPFSGTFGRRIYDYIFVPILGPDGEVEAVAGTTRDVTEMHETAEFLREQDQRKDEFLATLAHELRNPLAPVRNGLEILRLSGDLNEKAARARDMMTRQVGHMVRLIDDLMDVSRVSRGKVALQPERLRLATIVDTAIETSRPLIEAARHALVVSMPEPDLPLDGDLTRLAQVLGNLLNNAAKYTPEGGRIELSARSDGPRHVLIRVQDNGVGIPPDMLPRVFDLFTQVGRDLARAQGGLGIGLSLARKLVEMHGGTLDAQSTGPDQGAAFDVRLPLATVDADAVRDPEDRTQTPLITSSTTPSAGQRLRVLVVDDNVDAAETLTLLLQMAGHHTLAAHDGPAALALTDRWTPDAVFLDIGMPGMSGYELLERLRLRPDLTGATFVALTGWGSEDDRRLAHEAGFDFHLTKPADPARVGDILSSLAPRTP